MKPLKPPFVFGLARGMAYGNMVVGLVCLYVGMYLPMEWWLAVLGAVLFGLAVALLRSFPPTYRQFDTESDGA